MAISPPDSDEVSIRFSAVKIAKKDDIPTLDVNEDKINGIPNFVVEIRNKGELVYKVSPNGDMEIVKNLRQSPLIGEVAAKDWVFPVRLIYDGEEFYVLLQRFKFRFVGFRVSNGGWILPKGEYHDRVLHCVEAYFSDKNKILIEPKQVDLGTSLIKTSGVALTDLKFNRQVIINALVYLRGPSLGIPFDNSMIALHFSNLSQMICEAAKIEAMSCYINRHYFSNDFDTPNLTARLIKLQRSWTKASRKVAGWIYGNDSETFQLDGDPLSAEEVIAMYPYTKGITPSELESD